VEVRSMEWNRDCVLFIRRDVSLSRLYIRDVRRNTYTPRLSGMNLT
jgi:hypothetical protein